MFKERLKEVGKKILEWVTIVIFAIVFLVVVFGVVSLATNYTAIATVLGYVLYAFYGLMILSLIIYIVAYLCIFINWLFIEPYKARKKRGNNNDK